MYVYNTYSSSFRTLRNSQKNYTTTVVLNNEIKYVGF